MAKFFLNNLNVGREFPVIMKGPVAFIPTRYCHQQELIAYARCRSLQFWKNPLFHNLLYRFNLSYRFKCELKAFKAYLDKVEPKYYAGNVLYISKFLAEKCKMKESKVFNILANL